ncbi:MAG: hypothetical protein WC823_07085 [Parcubacteria group bacterium]|jgi:hypothetical protein
MEGMPKIAEAVVEKNISREGSYATIKESIMRHSSDVIGGTMDEVENKNNLVGRVNVSEKELVLEILQYLAPDNPNMWRDEEILAVTRKIVRERLSGKIVVTPIAEEIAQSEEEIADMLRRIESDKLSVKKPDHFKYNKKMRADSWGHEKSLGVKNEDD